MGHASCEPTSATQADANAQDHLVKDAARARMLTALPQRSQR